MSRQAVRNQLDARYASDSEPWSFAERGAEILRHEWTRERVRALLPRERRALVGDMGCSLGQLTTRLAALPCDVVAVDVSTVAVARTAAGLPGVSFAAGSATELPFRAGAFDVVIAADGIRSWDLSPSDRQLALGELGRVAAPGGFVVLTEHLRPDRFDEFIAEITLSGLRIRSVEYLYDRPWYQFESWLKAVQGTRVARVMRRSVAWARVLRFAGRLLGRAASRHIVVITERIPESWDT